MNSYASVCISMHPVGDGNLGRDAGRCGGTGASATRASTYLLTYVFGTFSQIAGDLAIRCVMLALAAYGNVSFEGFRVQRDRRVYAEAKKTHGVRSCDLLSTVCLYMNNTQYTICDKYHT